ncbi:helicase HerA domain-containing protein [Streptomyces kutzneri]|uniref:helicase HerA domain-containing protein n=1 Tax=Streptomyces kutzneri TaxID=3051179 RepID=UPI0028D417D3|nr:DUF87 domain-containing protein [Streptomyces sp. DSM 40907]
MPESAPLIGLGAGKKKVSVDLDADSPHVLISAGTGGGKSTILRCITCQFIHNGAHAFVLDFKRISHTLARGVPGVTYCRDIAEIHDALIGLAQEGRRRLALAEQLADDVLEREPWRVRPRIVILLEEVNATMAQLKRYWANSTKRRPPTTPSRTACASSPLSSRTSSWRAPPPWRQRRASRWLSRPSPGSCSSSSSNAAGPGGKSPGARGTPPHRGRPPARQQRRRTAASASAVRPKVGQSTTAACSAPWRRRTDRQCVRPIQ